MGFRVIGFRVLGLRAFRVLGFRVLGFSEPELVRMSRKEGKAHRPRVPSPQLVAHVAPLRVSRPKVCARSSSQESL